MPTTSRYALCSRRTGIARWLADRLVSFLPLAFGRILLRGASLSDDFVNGDTTSRLSDEPVFAAAQERATRAIRVEVEAIGLRSWEMHAVNDALQAGSRLEDLEGTPTVFVGGLASSGHGDGGVPSPRDAFAAFLKGHGYEVDRSGGKLRSGALEFDAHVIPTVHPNRCAVQVDFAAWHPTLAANPLVESFGGFGTTWKEAIDQTILKFESGALHVLIAGLLDSNACADQVTWEKLDHARGPFDVCLGPQLTLYASEPKVNLSPLLDRLYETLRGAELSRATHALRLYVCWNRDELTGNEVLLDNEPWRPGSELVAAATWPRVDRFWGTRLFLLLVPAP